MFCFQKVQLVCNINEYDSNEYRISHGFKCDGTICRFVNWPLGACPSMVTIVDAERTRRFELLSTYYAISKRASENASRGGELFVKIRSVSCHACILSKLPKCIEKKNYCKQIQSYS